MNTSGDAAEQIVRMSLEGFQVTAKIAGSGAKDIAALLIAIMKDKHKTAGKTNLSNMLKSGKELKVFSVRKDEFKKFTEEAKRYGVLFSAIVEKNNYDGMVDIMTKEEDASKINRIVERFKLATVDMAVINSEVEKIKEEKAKGFEPINENEKQEKEEKEKSPNKEKQETANPTLGKTERNHPLEPSLKNKENLEVSTKDKPSVREEIKEIKKEMNKVTEHKQVRSKERKKVR